jgi:hypothetical protein
VADEVALLFSRDTTLGRAGAVLARGHVAISGSDVAAPHARYR